MRGFRHCPIPLDGGNECWNEPHPDSTVGLCGTHWRYFATTWVVDDAITHRTRCPFCGLLAAVVNSEGIAFCINNRCNMTHNTIDLNQIAESVRLQREYLARQILNPTPRIGVIYYALWGDRIKIGTTANLKQRMSAIYHDVVLAVEPGSYNLESKRHEEFNKILVRGQREWFYKTPELVAHVNKLRRQYGEPYAAAERILAEKEAA